MKEKANIGFQYTVEHIRDGEVLSTEVVDNIIPTEGCNYVLNTSFVAGAALTPWYVGLFEGNYTPVAGDTAATFPASATECTAYAEAARVTWVPGTVAAGAVDNSASRAVFTVNATKTVYGGFMTSVATKGSTLGVLGSAVRFAAPKAVTSGDILRVTSGVTLVGA